MSRRRARQVSRQPGARASGGYGSAQRRRLANRHYPAGICQNDSVRRDRTRRRGAYDYRHTQRVRRQNRAAARHRQNKTHQMIKNSLELQSIFKRYQINSDKVINYHDYPIADNDTPKLSADRLEYTLSNAVHYQFMTKEDIQTIYKHIKVNDRKDEIIFDDLEIARLFTQVMLKCSLCYTSDENRFSMEYLARLIRLAIDRHVCLYDDLYTTETQVIQKLLNHPQTKDIYEKYTHFHKVLRSSFPQTGYLKVNAKKRYINPIVNHQRILDIDQDLHKKVKDYLSDDFERYIKAV